MQTGVHPHMRHVRFRSSRRLNRGLGSTLQHHQELPNWFTSNKDHSRSHVKEGNYSRIYSEASFEVDPARPGTSSTNQSVQTQTNIRFQLGGPNGSDLIGPIGSHILRVWNHSLSLESGQNHTVEYQNVTVFDGDGITQAGHKPPTGQDPLHPLTHFTNLLFPTTVEPDQKGKDDRNMWLQGHGVGLTAN